MDEALAFAFQRISLAVAKGEGAQALTLLKAAEGLAKLAPPKQEAQAKPPTVREVIHSEEGRVMVREAAERLADAMIKRPAASGGHSWFVYDWRARNLGTEVEAQDWADAKFGGWGSRYWWPDGRRKTLEEVQAAERADGGRVRTR